MDKIEIIERISRCRTMANLTARALSQKIELNDGYINRLESKKDFLPSVEVLMRIIEACNVVPEKFFYPNMEQFDLDMQLLDKVKRLDAQSKSLVADLADKILER